MKLDPTLKRFIVFFTFGFVVFVAALIYAARLGSQDGAPARPRTMHPR